MRQIKRRKYKNIQLDNIDIREILDDLEIEYFESGKNVSLGWIGVSCPFCMDDESNHLGLCLKSPVISCFKCGKTGNYLTYLIEELQSFEKALDILHKHESRELKIPYQRSEQTRSIKVNIPDEAKSIIGNRHANYLKGRRFDPIYLTKKYNLHFCKSSGKWANRIIVPIYNRNKILTYTSIDISKDSKLRYKHLSKELSVVHVKELIYGTEFTNGVICCLVEGIFDKYRIGNGAVTGFGVTLTSKQKLILSKYSKVIIIFDSDQAGIEGANKLANELAPFVNVEILDLPEGTDPDTLSKEDLRFIRGKIDGKY